jgi:hypothetical protein
MAEILASLDDINAELPSEETDGSTSGYPTVVEATDENTYLLQVSVARVVRGYLSGAVDSVTLMGWDQPTDTPEVIRVIAAKFIAAQLFFNQSARTSLTIDDQSFAQKRYDEAMDMLNKILEGVILLGPEVPVVTASLDLLDFFPVDDTDRAFTRSMEL